MTGERGDETKEQCEINSYKMKNNNDEHTIKPISNQNEVGHAVRLIRLPYRSGFSLLILFLFLFNFQGLFDIHDIIVEYTYRFLVFHSPFSNT